MTTTPEERRAAAKAYVEANLDEGQKAKRAAAGIFVVPDEALMRQWARESSKVVQDFIETKAQLKRAEELLLRSQIGKWYGGGPFDVRCAECEQPWDSHRDDCLVGEIAAFLEEA